MFLGTGNEADVDRKRRVLMQRGLKRPSVCEIDEKKKGVYKV